MTIDAAAADLEARLPGRVRRNAAVADLSTYRLGGPVAVLVRVGDDDNLAAVAKVVATHRPPVLVVGRGSNLLVGDDGFPGVAVLLEDGFEALHLGAADETRSRAADVVRGGVVRAGGALAVPVLARRTASAGLAGLEFFVGIPGSVGGAVRMNAGGHGRETADVLHRAWLVDLYAGGEPAEHAAADLELGYRHSAVSATQVVVRAEFAVTRDDTGACETRVAEIVRWRREHQPGGANAGSVFRNPPGDSAGRVIDAAGLKGLRVGGAVVSPKHANFFQAEPGATATDVARLVAEVQRRVADESGVHLVPELVMVGQGFDGVDGTEPVR
jgi:UDP-N-acetylmuramate dehydrogenase